MRVLILSLVLLVQGYAWATKPSAPTTCVNLKGNYVLPLGKHDRTDHPPILMIDQDYCRLISIVIGYPGFIPIGQPSSLDGTEGFFIVGDTIVEKGSLTIPTAKHGQCSAQQITLTLNADKNLVMTSPRVSGCEDKYKGPLNDTFPRMGWKPTAATAAANGITCADAKGNSVSIANSTFIFQNLDAVGLPSGKAFDIVGSHYEAVPGGANYSEYTGLLDGAFALVRLSKVKAGTVGEVWVGRNANGAAAFKGACNGEI